MTTSARSGSPVSPANPVQPGAGSCTPEQLTRWHNELGIPADYGVHTAWTLQQEPAELADAGLDVHGRPQRLEPAACRAWQNMQRAAASEGVVLYMLSAFRSIEYQHGLIHRKLERGLDIEQILQVNAAPGFSEHHTGRAVDIGTDDCPHLEEEFEQTSAFRWLQGHASRFGFTLSYPRDNPQGIVYEPWHWCYTPGATNKNEV